MGISAGTLAAVFGGISAAATVYKATQKPEAPQLQTPVAPPASQAAKTPEQNVYKAALRGAGGQGSAGGTGDATLLTGPGGVPNDSLLLGKSTLLGS